MIDSGRVKQFVQRFGLYLFVSLCSANAAADTWYQVEVILVGYLNPTDMDKVRDKSYEGISATLSGKSWKQNPDLH